MTDHSSRGRLQAIRIGAPAACLGAAVLAAGGAAAATLKHGYPFAPGDTFTYDYRATNSVKASCAGTPTVSVTAYTETTAIMPETTYSYAPGKSAAVYPFETTASGTTAKGALTVTNTDYLNFGASGKDADLKEYGFDDVSNWQEANNVQEHLEIARKYLAPLARDQLPRQHNKTLPFPVGFNEVDDHYYLAPAQENILQSNQTRQDNGSYTASGMTFSTPFSVQQKADGTGQGIEGPSTAPETWIFALPEAAAKGYVIPVMASYAGTSGTNDVPDWYPGKAAPPSPLAGGSYVDKGGRKVPAGCGAYAGKVATLLQMTYRNLGSVEGYVYSETDDYYVISGVGRACVVVTQNKRTYDQEVTGKCLSESTFKSTEGLVSESLQ